MTESENRRFQQDARFIARCIQHDGGEFDIMGIQLFACEFNTSYRMAMQEVKKCFDEIEAIAQ